MIKNILFVALIFFTSFVFSQNKDSKTAELATSTTIKNNSTPKLVAFDKSGSSKNKDAIKNDVLSKPELKLFAINQINTTSKKNDSIILSEPKLIPYTGYKKEIDN